MNMMSSYDWAGIPDGISIAIALVAFSIALAPWFGGLELGPLKVPKIATTTPRWARLSAFIALAAVLAGFFPWIEQANTERNDSAGSAEFNRTDIVAICGGAQHLVQANLESFTLTGMEVEILRGETGTVEIYQNAILLDQIKDFGADDYLRCIQILTDTLNASPTEYTLRLFDQLAPATGTDPQEELQTFAAAIWQFETAMSREVGLGLAGPGSDDGRFLEILQEAWYFSDWFAGKHPWLGDYYSRIGACADSATCDREIVTARMCPIHTWLVDAVGHFEDLQRIASDAYDNMPPKVLENIAAYRSPFLRYSHFDRIGQLCEGWRFPPGTQFLSDASTLGSETAFPKLIGDLLSDYVCDGDGKSYVVAAVAATDPLVRTVDNRGECR